MSAIDDFLKRSTRHAAGYTGSGLSASPSRAIAVVACMDARLDTSAALGLEAGEAHVIRNAGGVVTDDVLRSLTISQRLLGTREIMLIQHTDCGMATFTDDELRDRLRRAVGNEPPFPILAFAELEESLRSSIAQLRACPFLEHREAIRGFAYDIATGRLREITAR